MRYRLLACTAVAAAIATAGSADPAKSEQARMSSPGPTPPAAKPSPADAMNLVCIGGGTAIKPTQADISGSQSGSYDYGKGHYSGTFDGTVTGTRAQDYADQVDIELSDGKGRIRLPRIVLPPIHGGNGGWFDIEKLTVGSRTIEGSAAINFINKPKVHIDRATGTISITGMNGTYVGRCKRIDPSAARQF